MANAYKFIAKKLAVIKGLPKFTHLIRIIMKRITFAKPVDATMTCGKPLSEIPRTEIKLVEVSEADRKRLRSQAYKYLLP